MMYYESIDVINLWRWRKAMSGDLTYCRIDLEKGTEEEDLKAWDRLRDEDVEIFGLGAAYEEIIELQIQIALLQCEYVESGTTFMLNEINSLKTELKDILDRPIEFGIDECIIYLSKWLSFHFDEKVRTVKEFRTYLKTYHKEAERLEELTKKK